MPERNNRPWSFDEAREMCRKAAVAQENSEEEMRRAARDLAAAEQSYRVALAKRIVELHADGVAWSSCSDLARGDEKVANLRMLRDVAEGVYQAMQHAAWRHNQNRKDAQRYADWSQRRELAEAGVGSEQPEWTPALVESGSR